MSIVFCYLHLPVLVENILDIYWLERNEIHLAMREASHISFCQEYFVNESQYFCAA